MKGPFDLRALIPTFENRSVRARNIFKCYGIACSYFLIYYGPKSGHSIISIAFRADLITFSPPEKVSFTF